ncbi:MAG: Transcription-repair coupling factor [uncultured Cytophagales bacterium]|uniref:Transcription-repair coupling factor n=1 Tax=uncultured Cytophagales bacterium TaxID=158755 RepID=A0A6J4I6L1_9SPHI|nr:MAG: Transcription-repair coupling factor [uncultured Cytophagales bacterium]
MNTGSILLGTHPYVGKAKTESLIEKNGQRVILKTFRAGEGMPPHHAPVDVLVVVLEGKMHITLEATSGEFEAGDFVTFPAGSIHSLHCLQDAKVLIYR